MSGTADEKEVFRNNFKTHLEGLKRSGFVLKGALGIALKTYERSKQGDAKEVGLLRGLANNTALFANRNYRILHRISQRLSDRLIDPNELNDDDLNLLYDVLNSRGNDGSQTNISWLLAQALGICWNPTLDPENLFHALLKPSVSPGPRPEVAVLNMVNYMLRGANNVSAYLSGDPPFELSSFFSLMVQFESAEFSDSVDLHPVTKELSESARVLCLAGLKADLPLRGRFRTLRNGLFAILLNENFDLFKQLMTRLIASGNALESFPDYVQKAYTFSIEEMRLMVGRVIECTLPVSEMIFTAVRFKSAEEYAAGKESSAEVLTAAELALYLSDFERITHLDSLIRKSYLDYRFDKINLLYPKSPEKLMGMLDDALKSSAITPEFYDVVCGFLKHKKDTNKFPEEAAQLLDDRFSHQIPLLSNIVFYLRLLVLADLKESNPEPSAPPAPAKFSGSAAGAGAGGGAACGSADGAGAGAGGWVAPRPSAPPASVEPVPLTAEGIKEKARSLILQFQEETTELRESNPGDFAKQVGSYPKLVLTDCLAHLRNGTFPAEEAVTNYKKIAAVPDFLVGFHKEFRKFINSDLRALTPAPSAPPAPTGSAPFCADAVAGVSTAVSPACSPESTS